MVSGRHDYIAIELDHSKQIGEVKPLFCEPRGVAIHSGGCWANAIGSRGYQYTRNSLTNWRELIVIAAKYIFRIAVGVTAFLIGHTAYAGVQYLFSNGGSCLDDAVESEIAHTAAPEPFRVADVHVDGYYYLFDEPLIDGFPHLDYIDIQTMNEYGASIPLRGAVHEKREHKFASVSLIGDRLEFETATVDGVSFWFSGTFVPANLDDVESSNVIRGKFTKVVKGKNVGSMYVSFYPGGGC